MRVRAIAHANRAVGAVKHSQLQTLDILSIDTLQFHFMQVSKEVPPLHQ
jgi:hypothetical protein